MWRRLAAAISLAIVALAGPPALAQHFCDERDALIARRAEHYHEVPVAAGLSAQGTLVEVLSGPEGSWTMIVTEPAGRACIVAVGDAWERVPVRREEPLS